MDLLSYKALSAALCMTICSTVAAKADEAALYDQAPPADAVFVRVLASADDAGTEVSFGDLALPLAEIERDTYLAISAAELSDVSAGAHYSVVFFGDETRVIEEPERETAAKVHLILVNASASPVRLIVAQKNAEVVGAIGTGESASRAVNPVQAKLAVQRIADEAVLGTFDVDLARGQNLTFVANNGEARLIENRFGPVLTLN